MTAVGLLLWFELIVMPFEEKEMRALFGQDYVTYAKMVPGFIPSAKVVRRHPSEGRER